MRMIDARHRAPAKSSFLGASLVIAALASSATACLGEEGTFVPPQPEIGRASCRERVS
jgi:hypothetical protein